MAAKVYFGGYFWRLRVLSHMTQGGGVFVIDVNRSMLRNIVMNVIASSIMEGQSMLFFGDY